MTKEQVIQQVRFPVSELSYINGYNSDDNIQLPIPGKKAIYRTDTNEILGLVGNKYQILPHSQVVETVFESLDKEKIEYTPTKCKVIGHGEKVFLHLLLPEVHQIGELGDGIQSEIIIKNSYDGTTSFGLELGGYRLVCKNGMRAWHKDLAVTKKHYISEPILFIQQFFTRLKQFKEELVPFFNSCAQLNIKKAEGIKLIGNLAIAKKYQQDAVRIWMSEEQRSLWTLYNVLTYIATHSIQSYMVSRNIQLSAIQMAQMRMRNQ